MGIVNLKQAQQRSKTAQFSSVGRPQEMLRPMPKPHLNQRTSAISVVSPGQDIEFPVVGADSRESGFSGINTEDSNDGNGGGTAGIVEPPDQGLATNGSQVFETVNLSLRIFSASGAPLTDNIGIAAFFGVPFSNANLSDPRVFFDPQSRRFFFTVLEYFTNPTTGAITGSNNLLAVSQTSDATGNYYVYVINASDSGNAACTPGCLADQPLIGVNDDGFYISNNEFSNTAFVEAMITALDKEPLLNNTGVSGVLYGLPADFSVEPALPAPGTSTTANNGTEYFTESLDGGSGGNSLRIFALTQTENLENGTVPVLTASDFATESYSAPVPANQKAGTIPLGQQLGDPEEFLNTNDDRMLQLYYANGKLYTTLETELKDPDAAFRRSGAAWFVIAPTVTGNVVSAHILHQGYIGISNGTVLFPAFAVNNWGEGIIGFSFSGTNYFPSTGYVRYNDGAVEPKVRTAGAGQNPEDGFTGYPQFGGTGVARWGDYSASFVAPNGNLWFAAEYIPNTTLHPRTQFTNWGTFVARVQ